MSLYNNFGGTKLHSVRMTTLKSLMTQHSLSRQQVADLLGIRVATVHCWFSSPGSSNYRAPPARMVELLELKLQAREDQEKMK